MTELAKLFKQGKYEEIWQTCCGFIDLNINDFLKIQEHLLREQLQLLNSCELGRTIMRGASPTTASEFRKSVPLTTYADYAPFLLNKREDVLPEKPKVWMHTSGRSGEYPFKWVPVSPRQYEELGPTFLASAVLASCREKGEVNLRFGDRYLYALAPPPYFTGVAGRRVYEFGCFHFLPPTDKAEGMDFTQRIQEGFKLALSDGMEMFGGLTSVLIAISDRFGGTSGLKTLRPLLLKPRACYRILRALVRSKAARRRMLPKDVWSLKAIVTGGTDTNVFKEKIKELWGRYPLDIYACTEAGMIAMQAWDYQGMTFLPYLNFLEFIPELECLRSREDPEYKPEVLLLDEVEVGKKYEIVITSFLGGPFVRYRVGDLIKIIALQDTQLGINIPQMSFYSRVDDLLDIAGFTRLTEGVIWQAVEKAGILYIDWTIRKEIVNRQPVLNLYLELKPENTMSREEIVQAVHGSLKELDADYASLEAVTGLKPLKVTPVKGGSFAAYTQKQRDRGADLAHLKIPHINPFDNMIDSLTQE
ncbi:MAG: GH3 auxin-responsive promoter family protein [Dehalococcoidales bacterium]|nr:GH3 auxin-responsive promoter family protein [Dehalococcoidales bacterium]